ncbi:MAG: ferredoxin--NADP(+) reductase, partial [Bacilli bacterium]
IASGFGEAPVAVNQAKVYGDPTAKITHLHSTSLFQ